MGVGLFEHWGVEVRPGEMVKCDPGQFYCHVSQILLLPDTGNEDVRVFVKVGGKEILIGTLSVDKYPQFSTDLVFEKEFELLHNSKTSNICATGYIIRNPERKSSICKNTEQGDESDEEVPLAIPLYSNADDYKIKETKSGTEKLATPKHAADQSAKPKIASADQSGKLKADAGGSDYYDSDEDSDYLEEDESDDQDSSGKDDSESADEYSEDSPENTKCKNSPEETPLETPPEKKARIATPSVSNKAGSGTDKRSGHVHVATPHPSSKQVKRAPWTNDNSKQSTGYACTSCGKTFNSSIGLETHCKVKHSAHK